MVHLVEVDVVSRGCQAERHGMGVTGLALGEVVVRYEAKEGEKQHHNHEQVQRQRRTRPGSYWLVHIVNGTPVAGAAQ